MSTYNVLLYQQGGTLYLDEMLPDQPSSCTITITQLSGDALSDLGGAFADIEDAAASVGDLVLTLPSKSAPWRVITPTTTAGTIGDLTAEGRRLLLNRGGRKRWVRVSEFDTASDEVTEIRFDEGIDYALRTGDTLKDVRCYYAVDWSTVTSSFVGRVKATWTVTIGGVAHIFVKVYDVVKQILFCPASWSDVQALRPDVDNEMSQVLDKELLVQRAWQDVIVSLSSSGIRHNLIVPDGSTILRDAVIHQCIINLVQYHGLMTPPGYIGQTDDYVETLEARKAKILGKFVMPVDNDQNGNLSDQEQYGTKRQHWFRRPNFHRGRG